MAGDPMSARKPCSTRSQGVRQLLERGTGERRQRSPGEVPLAAAERRNAGSRNAFHRHHQLRPHVVFAAQGAQLRAQVGGEHFELPATEC